MDLPGAPTEYRALSLKNWRPEAGFIYGGGAGNAVAGRAAVLFSDMLRDHVLFVDVSVLGSFDLTQALAMYENRSERTGLVFGGYHFVQQNIDALDPNLAYLQRDFGILGALRYPLDRFQRVEVETTFGARAALLPRGLQPGPQRDLREPLQRRRHLDRRLREHRRLARRNGGVELHDAADAPVGLRHRPLRLPDGPGLRPLAAPRARRRLRSRHGTRCTGSPTSTRSSSSSCRAGRSSSCASRAAAPSRRIRRGEIWERSWWLTSADNLRGFYPLDLEDLIGRNYYVANAELQVPLDAVIRLFIFDYIAGVAAPRLRRRLRPLDDPLRRGPRRVRGSAPERRRRLGRPDPHRRPRRERALRAAPPPRPLRPPVRHRRVPDPRPEGGATAG